MIAEVFRSIQGEGPYVGVLQLFLRTSGCRRSCIYCDTPAAREKVRECVLRGPDASRKIPNPVGSDEIASFIRELAGVSSGVRHLSLTGGEPLEQPAFVIDLIARTRTIGLPVYLETNGLEESAAREVAPLVDIVALDIKLPSLCGGGDLLDAYRRVLPLFRGKELFCKVVIAEGFDEGEFALAVELVERYDPGLPFVIQPASPVAACRPVGGEKLLECYMSASRGLRNVLLIPQCHHLLGLP